MVKKLDKDKKILVTGATGFKGAWLCFWLNMMGSKVFGIGYNPNKNKDLFYNLGLQKKINYSLVDVRDLKKIRSKINTIKPEIIFHLAAQPLILDSYKKPYETYMINSIGTLNIMEVSKDLKSLKALVCITSDKCYQSNNSKKGFLENDKLGGEDPYSGSKANAEIIVNTYYKSFFKLNKKCGVATGRAGNVIGGGDWSENRLIPDAIRSINKKQTIFLRNPYFNRPWQHVLEPLYGYLILASKLYNNPNKFSGGWNFGSKKNTVTDVLSVVNQIIHDWGDGRVKFYKKKKYYEQENLQLNINKAKKILKWEPCWTIKKSISKTVEWYKDYLVNNKNAEQITKKQIVEYLNDIKKKN